MLANLPHDASPAARAMGQQKEGAMPKGEEKTNKSNKPKLPTAEKQKKKKEKAAAKKSI